MAAAQGATVSRMLVRPRSWADQPGIEHQPPGFPPSPTFAAIPAAPFNQLQLQSELSCRYRGTYRHRSILHHGTALARLLYTERVLYS
jgi:hypothetical protein